MMYDFLLGYLLRSHDFSIAHPISNDNVDLCNIMNDSFCALIDGLCDFSFVNYA